MPYKDKAGQAVAARRHYEKNRDKMIARAKKNTVAQRIMIRQAIDDYLAVRACVDCGEADRVVLEFDHRPEEPKRFDLGNANRDGYGLASVLQEMAKCDIRCANCHRRKTKLRQGLSRCDDRSALPAPSDTAVGSGSWGMGRGKSA